MAPDPIAFIRRTTVPVVLDYLHEIGVRLPSGIDATSLPEEVLAALQVAAPRDPRVWTVFEDAEAFAPRQARDNLRSVLVNERGLLAAFDAMTVSNRDCALWLAGTRPDLFSCAVSALNASKHLGGRSWDGFEIKGCDPMAALDLSDGSLRRFEQNAREAINHFRIVAPDSKLKADSFRRLITREESHPQRSWTQITIYAEGPKETREALSENNEVVTEIAPRVDEGAVLFDPSNLALEVYVLGGAKARLLLAEAFCDAFMPDGAIPIRIVKRNIDLSRFKSEPDFPLFASDAVEKVAVDEIRLSSPNSDAGLLTLEHRYRASSPTNIYRDVNAWPDAPHLEQLADWSVVAVRIRFLFKGEGQSLKPRLRTVELKAPNRTNLREKSSADHAVMHELLVRWGILETADDAEE